MTNTLAKTASTLLAALLLLSSCTEQKQLTSHDGFQKRKYLKGHYQISRSLPEATVAIERLPRGETISTTLSATVGDELSLAEVNQHTHRATDIEAEAMPMTPQRMRSEKKSIKKELRTLIKELKTRPEKTSADVSKSGRTAPEEGTKLNVVGLIGFICGILGFALLAAGSWIGLVLGVAAFVLGIVSVGDFKRKPDTYNGRGFALTGLILGGTILFLLLLLAIIIAAFYSEGN